MTAGANASGLDDVTTGWKGPVVGVSHSGQRGGLY
jgi:hypothetical protein